VRVFLERPADAFRLSRRKALTLGAAAATLAAAPALASPTPSLGQLARDKGLRFGSAVGAGPVGSLTGSFEDAKYRAILADECGLLVPENELKWYVIRAAGPQAFDFSRADRIAAFAKANGRPCGATPCYGTTRNGSPTGSRPTTSARARRGPRTPRPCWSSTSTPCAGVTRR
jgi:hypothetical protein